MIFLSTNNGKVNNKSPNSLGNILITIDDISALADILSNKHSGDQADSKNLKYPI